MLSKNNYDKLDENYLYKRKPIEDNRFSVGTTPGTYHCKNWTFKVFKKDGKAVMVDTYWSCSYSDSLKFEVTDKNIEDFKKLFDFRVVKKIRDNESDEYDEDDLFYAATDSGGYSCGGCCWVLKDSKKSKDKLIQKTKDEIASLERKLTWAKEDLVKLESGEHYYLRT